MHADTDLDGSGDEDTAQPFSLGALHQEAVIAEPWGITPTPGPSSSGPLTSAPAFPTDSPQHHSHSTQWQAHWLELRIHALRQQQQRYDSRLQKLQQQQDQQAAMPRPQALPAPSNPQAEASLPSAHQQAAGPLSAPHQLPISSPSANQAPTLDAAQSAAQAQPLALHEHAPGAGASLVSEQTYRDHQQVPARSEPRYKHRHARHPVPGLAMPEIARHPFFCQHSAAGSAEQPIILGEPVGVRVKHATTKQMREMLHMLMSGMT